MRNVRPITVAQLSDGFDDVLDVRSGAEYADDHIPGAISVPVLDDEERAHIGTIYTQVSPFEAQKQGAVLIARNIARHLETRFISKPKNWRPLVYCWRGGQRSSAMAHILAQVGWSVGQLTGGYKAYRRHVLSELDRLPANQDFRVICGPTGSGKSRLLQALRQEGAQVLDLEELAQHRGSLLGNLPGHPQPSQRMFETRIWDMLRHAEPQRPVFVEAESRKIGVLSLPTILLERMHLSPCISLETPLNTRVRLLLEDYIHFLQDPAGFAQLLTPLIELHGRQTIADWRAMAEQGRWESLAQELLKRHYDPAYRRSSHSHYAQLNEAIELHLTDLAEMRVMARTLCERPAA